MFWNRLPLIEMDEGTDTERPIRKSRFDNDSGDRLELDIGKQLSQLREQTKHSQDNSKSDPFGRDLALRRGIKDDRNRSQDNKANYVDTEEGRDWDRGRRRRPQDEEDKDYSDGSEGSYEGGRNGDGYRSRYKEDNYGGRRDRDYDYRERDYQDHCYRDRDYRDRDHRDYRDREYRERDYRDRGGRDGEWRQDRREDDGRRGYREKQRHEEGRWSHDRYSEDRDYHRREFQYAEPSEIVILKGLPTIIEDSRIHEFMAEANLPYKDVRVVKNKEGYSRGFAFVEFLDVDTAKGWIDSNKGKLQMDDTIVYMDFSRSKIVTEPYKDWICGKCGTQNFSSKRRNTCFSCYAPRDENDEQKDVGQTPCKVLILRGLDTLTTEETIRHSLTSFTSMPIFDVRLIKDKMTGTSRGFCFVELASIEDASKLREEIQNASFKIDDRTVAVSYARFGTHPGPKGSTPGKGSVQTSSDTTTSDSTTSSTNQARPNNNFAANAIAQAHAAAKMGNDLLPSQHTIAQLPFPAPPPVLATPYVPPDSTIYDTTAQATTTTAAGVPAGQQGTVVPTDPSYGMPGAISSYVYDTASGFYYDTTTGLYYDPKTQYYYNASTQQYMFWDPTTQQYVTVMSTTTPSSVLPNTTIPPPPNISQTTQEATVTAPPTIATVTAPPTTTGAAATAAPIVETEAAPLSKEKQKKAKAFNAKKIAKDMERWAKKVNVNKDTVSRVQTAQFTDEATKESTYQYDPNDLKKAGIKTIFTAPGSISLASASPLAALSDLDGTSAQTTAAGDPSSASASLVAEYGEEDSGGEEDPNKEDNYSDWAKMACLLCKRQFPSKDVLAKHNQFSDLHKQNLQVQKKLKMSFKEINDYEKQQREAKYRDRARERRELFGQPDSSMPGPLVKRKRKGKVTSYEQPTKDGISSDNIGNKMLQAMGWTQGTGLGKERQGIVAPISAKIRNRTAGLGSEGSNYGAVAGDSERDMLKKMANSRYGALE